MRAWGYGEDVNINLDPGNSVEAEVLRRCVAFFLAKAESSLGQIQTEETFDNIILGIKEVMTSLGAAEDIVVAAKKVMDTRRSKPTVEEVDK